MEVNMLSRVADGMFWLNRYMKELMACCLRSTRFYMSFDQETNDYQGYKPLLENYTNLSPEVILKYSTIPLVLNHIICSHKHEFC
jgi:hypothetical protein